MKYIYSTIPALVILGIFAWFSNWIPQTAWEPPKKLQLSADMSPAELARLGETLVKERGCLICHTLEEGVGEKGRGRGPNLAGIGARPRSTPKYLAEALFNPGDFVVEGYVNIMPSAIVPPAKLTYEEMTAVVNYLLSLGGRASVRVGDLPRPPQQASLPASAAPVQQPTAPLPQPTTSTPTAPVAPSASQSVALEEAKAALNKYACLACHSLGGEGGKIGPALDRREMASEATKARLSVSDYIQQAIISPGAYVVDGYPNIMPPDLVNKMSAQELELMVKYLSSLVLK